MPSAFEELPLASGKKSSQRRRKGKSLFVSQPAASVRRPPLMLEHTPSMFRGVGAGRGERGQNHLEFLKAHPVTETSRSSASIRRQ